MAETGHSLSEAPRNVFTTRDNLPKHRAAAHFRTSAAREAAEKLSQRHELPIFQQRLKQAIEYKKAHAEDLQRASRKGQSLKRGLGASAAPSGKRQTDENAGPGAVSALDDCQYEQRLQRERQLEEERLLHQKQTTVLRLQKEVNVLAGTAYQKEARLEQLALALHELKTAEQQQLEFVHTEGLGSEEVLAKEEELNYTIDAIAEAEHTSRVLEKMKHRADRTSAELKGVMLKRQKEVDDHAHDLALLADAQLEPALRRDFVQSEQSKLQKLLEQRRVQNESMLSKRSAELKELNAETKTEGEEAARLEQYLQHIRDERSKVIETLSRYLPRTWPHLSRGVAAALALRSMHAVRPLATGRSFDCARPGTKSTRTR
jgi:chromosome segregation ATPase